MAIISTLKTDCWIDLMTCGTSAPSLYHRSAATILVMRELISRVAVAGKSLSSFDERGGYTHLHPAVYCLMQVCTSLDDPHQPDMDPWTLSDEDLVVVNKKRTGVFFGQHIPAQYSVEAFLAGYMTGGLYERRTPALPTWTYEAAKSYVYVHAERITVAVSAALGPVAYAAARAPWETIFGVP